MDQEQLKNVIYAMTVLSESFGAALPWANLVGACAEFASRLEISDACQELIYNKKIEVTVKGFRTAVQFSYPPLI